MNFNDKLLQLRKQKGYSQEQLAGMLDVSRQAVSKWEAGVTLPELNKLIALSDIFEVSLDYLVRETATERTASSETAAGNAAVMEKLDEIKHYIKKQDIYEYKSKTTLFGIPLVHIKFSRYAGGRSGAGAVAKGIIAIGNIAVGLISLGGISVGLFSLGGLSLGLLLALGGVAAGGIALGGVAFGVLAFGGAAIGIYAMGGAAAASELAAGGAAAGRVAVGKAVSGDFTLQLNDFTSVAQIRQFITEHCPGICSAVAWLFSMVC